MRVAAGSLPHVAHERLLHGRVGDLQSHRLDKGKLVFLVFLTTPERTAYSFGQRF